LNQYRRRRTAVHGWKSFSYNENTCHGLLKLQVYLKIHKRNSYAPDTIILDLLLCFTEVAEANHMEVREEPKNSSP